MKISKAIQKLQQIKKLYGDLDISGGSMRDDKPLQRISVLNDDGHEIWPVSRDRLSGENVEGVFLE